VDAAPEGLSFSYGIEAPCKLLVSHVLVRSEHARDVGSISLGVGPACKGDDYELAKDGDRFAVPEGALPVLLQGGRLTLRFVLRRGLARLQAAVVCVEACDAAHDVFGPCVGPRNHRAGWHTTAGGAFRVMPPPPDGTPANAGKWGIIHGTCGDPMDWRAVARSGGWGGDEACLASYCDAYREAAAIRASYFLGSAPAN
jgi:hypothetical protein